MEYYVIKYIIYTVRPSEDALQQKYAYDESFKKALQTQGKLSTAESIKVSIKTNQTLNN